MPRFEQLLQFTPIYQPRVWGGRRLETILRRTLPDGQLYGESWDLVDRVEHQSVVATGPHAGLSLHDLWTTHRREVFGDGGRQPDAARFPLLIKVLDCRDDLSIQVHPPASMAAALGGDPKTEMWFVAHADPDARMYAGLCAGVTRTEFEHALERGTVAGCVHRLHPREGDSLFLQSGRIHALGAGLLVFEIQQNSDTTYRVFDWNRAGLDGQPRTLHVEASLASIDFTDVEPALSRGSVELASCEYFRVTRARTGRQARPDRARLVMPIATTTWGGLTLAPAQLVVCPAGLDIPGPVGDWLEIEY